MTDTFDEIRELERRLAEADLNLQPLRNRLADLRRQKLLAEIGPMMEGNMVWCRNGHCVTTATPCQHVPCQFKSGVLRLANPAELVECYSFVITTISTTWDTTAHIFP